MSALQANQVKQEISIEVVMGGFVLQYVDLDTGGVNREVYVSQRKLLNRLKTVITASSLVPDTPDTKDYSED